MAEDHLRRRTLPPDYDIDPERFLLGRRNVHEFGSGDVHPDVASRFEAEGFRFVLDIRL